MEPRLIAIFYAFISIFFSFFHFFSFFSFFSIFKSLPSIFFCIYRNRLLRLPSPRPLTLRNKASPKSESKTVGPNQQPQSSNRVRPPQPSQPKTLFNHRNARLVRATIVFRAGDGTATALNRSFRVHKPEGRSRRV